MSPTRRRVLASGSAALATAFAGCIFFGPNNPSIFVTVVNESDYAHSVAVFIRGGSTTYLEGIITVDGGQTKTFDEGIFTPDTDVEAPVHVLVDDGRSTTERIPLTAETEIEIRLSPSGDIDVTLDETPESIAG